MAVTLHVGDCLNGCDMCREYHHQGLTGTCPDCGWMMIGLENAVCDECEGQLRAREDGHLIEWECLSCGQVSYEYQ